ncbi:MAG: TonB-dependent siderophore receptor [Nitrospira sp.]|nr:TonB-dependent siderophore receptor [Nitrospira sp.]
MSRVPTSWCVFSDRMRRRVAGCVLFLCLMPAMLPVLSHAQSEQVFEFDIPPQPLDQALKSFAATTDFLLSYDAAMTRGRVSTGITGRYAPVEALTRLLTDTGLNYRFANENTITLQPVNNPILTPVVPPQSQSFPPGANERPSGDSEKAVKQKLVKVPEILVKDVRQRGDDTTSYVAEETSASTKTDTPLLETPQTINVVTRAEMNTRLVQNVSQAVMYTPGVLTEMYGPAMRDDYFNIRGFDAPQFLDGLGLVGVNYGNLRIEPYGLERVEILKGPASMLYGQSSPGGLVNMTSKRPTEVPARELLLTGGSFGRIQGGLDLGGPIDEQGRLLFRITALGRHSDTQIDFAKDDRYFIAPSLTWRPSRNTSFTILSQFQKDDAGNTLQFLPPEGSLLGNPNGRIPINRFVGEPEFDRWKRQQYTAGYAMEHRFNESWKLEQNFRYAHVRTDYPTTFYLDFVRDGDGAPVDFRTISRLAGLYRDLANTATLDTRVQGAFETGLLRHTLLFGVDYRRLWGRSQRGFSDSPELDVYAPIYNQPWVRPEIDFASAQQRDQIGLYTQDQIKYNRVLLTLGARYDFVNADTQINDLFLNEQSAIRQRDNAATYRVGLSYLFDSGIAPYVSYATSFQPEAGTDFSGTPFKPTTGQQYEAGIKFKPVGYNALLTVSVYHLLRQNIVTPDLTPGHFGFNVQTGEARAQGFEVEGKANLTQALGLIAGYSFTDTKVTESNDPATLGRRLSLTPKHQASFWMDYGFQDGPLAGLNLGGGTRYTGSNFGDLANSLKAPSYVLFDAAVRYDLRLVHDSLRGAELSVNLNNLLDREYVATCADASCFYGSRRTVYASLRYRW